MQDQVGTLFVCVPAYLVLPDPIHHQSSTEAQVLARGLGLDGVKGEPAILQRKHFTVELSLALKHFSLNHTPDLSITQKLLDMSSSRIAELAALILVKTVEVDHYFRERGLPSPSFNEDGPVDFKIESDEIQVARTTAMEASLELYDLLQGPSMCLRPVVCGLNICRVEV